jgi:hypothetical protein
MLLPKTKLTLPEIRKIAKAQGYKVKSQTVGFDGDSRRVWHLVDATTGRHYFMGNVYPEAEAEAVTKAFALTKQICNQ